MAESKRERHIVDLYQAQRAEAQEQREEIEKYWVEAENLYLNKHDFSMKKDWQAKLFYSMTSPTVNKAARLIKQMVLKTEEYVQMDPIGMEDIALARGFSPATLFYLNNAQFPERFSESCASGFNYAIGINKMFCRTNNKTVYVNGRPHTRSVTELILKTLNPWHCLWPKDWSYFIEDSWMTVPELVRQARAGVFDFGKTGSGYAKVRDILGKDYTQGAKPGGDAADKEEARLHRLGIRDYSNKFRAPILLSTYWGPVIDHQGREIEKENQKFIIVNDNYVLQMPTRNPFDHQQWPYIFINPLKVLFRHIGEGLTWGVNPIQKEMTNILNMMSDALKFKMAGILEVNEDLLVDPNKPMELYPGKSVRRKSGDGRQKAIEHHELGADPEWAAGLINLLRNVHQNHTGITEYLMGAPTLKGSPTATEVATKTAESQSDFISIAQDVDRQGIVSAADMAKDLIIQYFADFSSYPNVRRIFSDASGDAIMRLDDDEKAELLFGDWDIRARGLSLFFERKEQINKLARWVDGMKVIPPELAQMRIDWEEYVATLNEAVWGERKKFWLEQPKGKAQQMGGNVLPFQQSGMEEETGAPTRRLPFGQAR